MNNGAVVLTFDKKAFNSGLPKTTKAIGKVASEFFKASFSNQGKTDGGFEPWKGRSINWGGSQRAILTKSGKLRRDIRHSSTAKRAKVRTTLPYSAIQNEGGDIPITPAMRRFFWAMYYKEIGGTTRLKSGAQSKSKTNIAKNKRAEIWKNLALTKGDNMSLPARPYIYHSRDLNKKIDRLIDILILKSKS